MVPDENIVYQTRAVTRAKAMRATEPAATALLIYAVITGVLGGLLVGQAISRRCPTRSARDNQTLAAIGATRNERFLTSMMPPRCRRRRRVRVAVGPGDRMSLLTPGRPRRAPKPDPGFQFAAPILVGGVSCSSWCSWLWHVPAWNSARQRRAPRCHARLGGRRLVGLQWCAPALSNGVRFGLEPGRGSTAVPTRATISARSRRSRWRWRPSCSRRASIGW